MKLRAGFVSNSSSGSFIFPKEMSVERVKEVLKKTEDFLSDVNGEKVVHGLEKIRIFTDKTSKGRYWDTIESIHDYYKHTDPKDYFGCVIADTIKDNSCPYEVRVILEQLGVRYFHYG
jgi:hypothetical protein